MITDGRQPEAITNAQVTKVANSCADTKSAAEETSQTAKKVSAVLIKMTLFSSPDTAVERDCQGLIEFLLDSMIVWPPCSSSCTH